MIKKGDILQLMYDVGWNKCGELAVACDDEDSCGGVDVKFENDSSRVTTKSCLYRKVNLKLSNI